MKCEGDRLYDQPGDCPVCNMHLVGADELEAVEHHEEHSKHDHHEHHHHDSHDSDGPDQSGRYYCPMRCEDDKT